MFGGAATGRERKRQKAAVTKQQADGALPKFVEVMLPAIVRPTGEQVGPLTVKIRTSTEIQATVWVELCVPALEYIRAGMLHDEAAATERGKSEDGVRWRKDRRRWEARRYNEATQKYRVKAFKAASDADVDMAAAKIKALAWVQGSGDEDADDGEDEEEVEL